MSRPSPITRLWMRVPFFGEHYFWRHVAGRLWLALPERRRWDVVSWYYERHPEVCWCDLVDAAYLDIKKDDYLGVNGCGCDVPLPLNARPPRGMCYCTPPAEVSQA